MMSREMELIFSVLLLCSLLTGSRSQTQQDEVCRKVDIGKELFVNETNLSENDFVGNVDPEDETETLKFRRALCRLKDDAVYYMSELRKCQKYRGFSNSLHRLFLLDHSIADQLNVMCDNEAFDYLLICVNKETQISTRFEDWMCQSNPHTKESILETMRVKITAPNYCSDILYGGMEECPRLRAMVKCFSKPWKMFRSARIQVPCDNVTDNVLIQPGSSTDRKQQESGTVRIHPGFVLTITWFIFVMTIIL